MTVVDAAPRRDQAAAAHDDAGVVLRLHKATGQLAGVTGMVADGRCCIDVLDQLSAVTAAVDAAALLLLSNHIHACVREGLESGDTDTTVDELVTAVTRYVRTR